MSLPQSYTSMVVVATVVYDPRGQTLVARVRVTGADRFEVQVQSAESSPAPLTDYQVHYIVVEEGTYTQAGDGITLEAFKYDSTVTDYAGNWLGEFRSYQNTYTSPVVIGQVMTVNDPLFCVFWARGSTLEF